MALVDSDISSPASHSSTDRRVKLLAIDTSGDACSAALLMDGIIEQTIEHAPRRHAELILGMMEQLLERSDTRLEDLDALAFGRGPGSFTGVRIAASVVQGAAFGAALPVVPVSTLAAMAQGQFRRAGQRRLLAAIDARMDEVYWGCYEIGEDGLAVSCCAECVSPPERISIPSGHGWMGVGSGWSAHGQTLGERLGKVLDGIDPDGLCEARDIATLAASELLAGRHVPAERAIPVYLRDQVTRTP